MLSIYFADSKQRYFTHGEVANKNVTYVTLKKKTMGSQPLVNHNGPKCNCFRNIEI